VDHVRPAADVARLVRSDETYEGRQGLTYSVGVNRENVGAQGLCMHLLRIPPGGRATAHKHEAHETAIYLIEGEVEVRSGEGLRERCTMRAGDFVYIPAGVPHLPINTGTVEAIGVLSRTDPFEQESVVLLPELESA
jgi:uncharacterized RmlC-like cupin family protein